MKKARIFLFLFTLINLVLFNSSCKREEFNWNNGSETIQTTGSISLPSNIDQSGWTIKSGLNTGSISNSNFKIKLNENAVQLLIVLNSSDQPVLLSVEAVNSQTSGKTISSETTAEALVFLNPFFCTSDLTEADELKQRIKSLSSFNYLVSTLNSEIQKGSFSITETNNNLISALDSVFKDLTSHFGVKKSLNLQNTEFTPTPDMEVNGLTIEDLQETTSEISFRIANRAKRWISVYVDKSTDGLTFIRSAAPVDLIPSPGISVLDLIIHGELIVPEYSSNIQNSTLGYQSFAVRCYGLGVLNDNSNEEFKRAILPAAASAVFDIGVPVFEVITGMNLHAELRGRPANHPFYKLVEKAIDEILKDAVLQGRFYTWYREGDVVKIAVETAKSIFSTCINNPSLFAQMLTQIVKQEVERSVVNYFFLPFRVINATITAANLGYAIGSVLSTEAVTDFRLNNSSSTLPVSVNGIIKSYSTSLPIYGASITSYDINGNIQYGTKSDANGSFTLKSDIGYLRIRIVAVGYKPTNQILQIPQDVVNQNPANFFAPTTWLSSYSSISGRITGIVNDATNLNQVSGVTIELRTGAYNLSGDIVQQVISSPDGSFSFTDIPSGTYTAFFSRQGYISDYLVISVLGGETSTGYIMNLSPDIATTNGYRIILTWGLDPRDLDSHLFTPAIDGLNYHVYWADKGDLINPPYANLDVDDRYSYGPETITIDKTVQGEYFYSVHHYEGVGSLTTTSNATISLYGVNGFIRSWTVPSIGEGVWWNVFSINGSTGAITNINQISDSAPGIFKGMAEEDLKKNKK